MSTTQRSITHIPPQPADLSRWERLELERIERADCAVAEARENLIKSLKAAVQTLTSEIARLEATGDIVDRNIERCYERLGFTTDSFRQEQELAQIAYSAASSHASGNPTFLGGLNAGVAQ